MTISAFFTGPSLPTGWTVDVPATNSGLGSHVFANERAVITVPAGTSLDGYSNGTNVDNTYGFIHDLAVPGGDVDIVVRVDSDVSKVKGFGLNLTIEGTGTDAARFAIQHANTNVHAPSAFAMIRAAASAATHNLSNYDLHMSGTTAFYRIKYVQSTGTLTTLDSADGVTWNAVNNPLVRSISAQRFKVSAHSATPLAGGSLRLGAVYDLIALGATDIRQARPSYTYTLVSEVLGSAGALPGDWANDSNDGGTGGAVGVSWVGGRMRLTTRPSINPTFNAARIRYTGTPLTKWAVYMRARCPAANSGVFATLGAAQPGSAGTGDAAWHDQYVPKLDQGGGYGSEIQSNTTTRRPIRMDQSGGTNITLTPPYTPTYLDELVYNHLNTNGVGVAQLKDNTLLHWWLEYDGTRFRMWEWTGAEGDKPTNPNVWDGEDTTYGGAGATGMRAALALSQNQNPAVLGADAQLDVERLAFFEMIPPAGLTLKKRSGGAWVPGTLKKRVGGAWVTGTLN